MPEQPWVPTIDDLRVKLCYICREEERYDKPEDPPRAWTHPCSCTLVAHESCLLEWITSAQQDSARVKNALKCPQCGSKYELESDNPTSLRILNALNASISSFGKVGTVVGAAGLAASFSFTLYVVTTSYGSFAVREFLGDELHGLLLGDDPSKWPWHAFIHLPVLPFSLILSRTRLFDTFPLVPLLLTWSSSPPVRDLASTSIWNWSASSRAASSAQPSLTWPPTPIMGMILFPLIRRLYRRAFDRLTKYVMGKHPVPTADAGPFRRVVFALNDDGPAPLRVRIGANIEAPAAPNGAAAAPAAADRDDGDDAVAAAERTLHVTTSSIGRFVGGALLIPTISKYMGALLLRLSRRSSWLRAFLAIGPRGVRPQPAHIRLFANPPGTPMTFRQLGEGLAAGVNVMCAGTPTWNSCEPVWWRNTVGLGLFVLAKDCVHLFHLWLMKREMESRRVKNRSFAGIDIKELDLINPPVDAPSNATAALGPSPQSDAAPVPPAA